MITLILVCSSILVCLFLDHCFHKSKNLPSLIVAQCTCPCNMLFDMSEAFHLSSKVTSDPDQAGLPNSSNTLDNVPLLITYEGLYGF